MKLNEPKVPKHHGGAQYHGSGVRTIGTHKIFCDVSASRFKQGIFLEMARVMRTDVDARRSGRTNPANIATRHDTGSTNESSTNVGYDSPVQIGHNHDVKLTGPGN